MRRLLPLVTVVAACGHAAERAPTSTGPAPGAKPTTVDARAKITTATRLWLAGDLEGAEQQLEGAGGDPRALALLARAHAIAGVPAEAQRANAPLANATVHIATDTVRITQAVLGPDGAYVATLESSPHYADGTVTVWSTVTGRDLFTIEANYARFGIEPASHAMLVVVWGDIHGSTKLRAFDAATGAPRWTVESPHRVYDVAIDRHGTLTALAAYRGSLVQYDLATGALRREIPTDANAARLQVSDDSTTAIAAETVMELPASGTQGVKLVEAPKYPTLSPDGRTLAIGRANGEVSFTERDGTPRTTVAHAGDDLQFLDDGSLLAIAKSHVKRFDPSGVLLGELELPGGLAPIGNRSFVTGPSGHLLARRGGELVVIALASGHPAVISTFGGATRATALAWSADGAKLGLAATDLISTVWTTAGATAVDLKSRFYGTIDTLGFDAAGKLVTDLGAWHDRVGARIFIRDPDGTAVRFVEADESLVAYDRAGAVLVGAGESGLVRVWNADTGQGLGEVGRAGAPVTALALRPDGKLLAVARTRGAVELWDLPSRTQLLAISAGAPAAVVAPDGRFDGNQHGLVRHAGEVDVPILATEAPTAGLAADALAKPPAPISIAPTPAARLAPRGCIPADESTLEATMATLTGDTLSYCLQARGDDPYCFTANLAGGGVVPAPAPIAAIAPPSEGRGWMPLEATPAGLRICARSGACHILPEKIDPQHQPTAVSADGTLLAIDRGGRMVELLDAHTGKRLARFRVHYGTPAQRDDDERELGFLGHSVLAISVPCAGPCGQGGIYDRRGVRLGELGVEASSFGAERFHDEVYVLHSIDEKFVVQDAATGKILIREDVHPHWDVALSPTRMVLVTATSTADPAGRIQVYDAAARPVARLEPPLCPPMN